MKNSEMELIGNMLELLKEKNTENEYLKVCNDKLKSENNKSKEDKIYIINNCEAKNLELANTRRFLLDAENQLENYDIFTKEVNEAISNATNSQLKCELKTIVKNNGQEECIFDLDTEC